MMGERLPGRTFAAHGLEKAMANLNASNQLASHKPIETESSTAATALGSLKLSS
jgi:hypothetical protein